MHRSIPLAVAAALILSAPGAMAKTRANPEAEIAKIVAKRTAGKPVNCIEQNRIRSSQVISRTAIIYTMDNGTIYVNRPDSGANFLSKGDVLITDTRSPRLCNVDIVRLADSGLNMPRGTVGLGHFVPYTKPPRSAAN